MADLSCSRTNRKHSSFATKHFQRKSLKTFDLHPPLRRLVSFVVRIRDGISSHRLKRSRHNCIILNVCHTLCILGRMAVMTAEF